MSVTLTEGELNETDKQVLEVLWEGRATPQLINKELATREKDVTREYVSQILRRFREHGHVENLHDTGVYKLVDDPRGLVKKRYIGRTSEGRNNVRFAGELDPRRDIKEHVVEESNSHYTWGYTGAGPHQLSVALLAEVRDDEFAKKHHKDFLPFVSSLDEEWSVTEVEIEEWIEENIEEEG